MNETYVTLRDENVDGCGTDVTCILQVNTEALTNGQIDRITKAVKTYKSENPDSWDSDGCFNAAAEQLEKEGLTVKYVIPSAEICF